MFKSWIEKNVDIYLIFEPSNKGFVQDPKSSTIDIFWSSRPSSSSNISVFSLSWKYFSWNEDEFDPHWSPKDKGEGAVFSLEWCPGPLSVSENNIKKLFQTKKKNRMICLICPTLSVVNVYFYLSVDSKEGHGHSTAKYWPVQDQFGLSLSLPHCYHHGVGVDSGGSKAEILTHVGQY